jgi:hypothetical protein
MIHNHWLNIAQHNSQPFAQHKTLRFKPIGSALLIMIHSRWISIAHHDLHPMAQHNTP